MDFMAKLAFEAYSNAVGGKNVAGYPIPDWENLGDPVQNAWVAAADAVAEFLMTPDHDDTGDYAA